MHSLNNGQGETEMITPVHAPHQRLPFPPRSFSLFLLPVLLELDQDCAFLDQLTHLPLDGAHDAFLGRAQHVLLRRHINRADKSAAPRS